MRMFQSYLTGIEMLKLAELAFNRFTSSNRTLLELKSQKIIEVDTSNMFQSYLTGIEIRKMTRARALSLVPIVPYWN